MTPAAPKGKPIKIATANTEPDVAAFYETFAQEHGEEAGSYLEFVETLTTMVRASVDAGNKPASMKKYLNALTFEDYAAALAEQRTLERVDTEDIRDEFAALVEQKKQGEAIDLEAFVQSKYEALQARYPSENLGTLDVFATTLLERMQSEDFDGSLRRLLEAGDLFRGLPDGQVLPAEEIVACAGAVRQSGVGGGDFLFHGQQVGQGDLTPYIGDINFNHVVGHVLSFIYVILSYVTANSPETQAPSQKVSMGTVPNFFIFSTGNFARIMYNGERTLLSRRRN